MAKGYRGYITSRPFLGERAPQHVQNLVIRDYAERRDLEYKLSATEYVMPGCYMMLEEVLAELDTLDGMICYSVFQLPLDARARARAYERVLETSTSLHTAVEGLVVSRAVDAQRIENIWKVRQALQDCPGAADLKGIA